MSLLNVSGSSFAFVLGTYFNEEEAIVLQLVFWVFYSMGSGVFRNLNKANHFVYLISYISPYRYSCEALLRLVLVGRPEYF